MPQLSRALRRWDPIRVASVALGLAAALLLAAFGVGAATSTVGPGSIVSAAALLAIVVAGLLYAFRLGAGGHVE